jgi:hypothetical protein
VVESQYKIKPGFLLGFFMALPQREFALKKKFGVVAAALSAAIFCFVALHKRIFATIANALTLPRRKSSLRDSANTKTKCYLVNQKLQKGEAAHYLR